MQGIENSGERHKLDDFETETESESSYQTEPLEPKLPHGSSPRLKNTHVNNPTEPNFQQRHSISAATLENVSYAGIDGMPSPENRLGIGILEFDNG